MYAALSVWFDAFLPTTIATRTSLSPKYSGISANNVLVDAVKYFVLTSMCCPLLFPDVFAALLAADESDTISGLPVGVMCSNCQVNTIPIKNHWNRRKGSSQVKEDTSAPLVQSGLSEKWWAEALECFCYLRTFLKNCWTESHRMTQELARHMLVELYHVFVKLVLANLHGRQVSSPSIWYQDADAKHWRRLHRRLHHRGQTRHRGQHRVRGPRQKIQLKRRWSQEIAGSIRISLRRCSMESRNCRKHSYFLAQMFSKTRRSRTTSNLTPPESREIRRMQCTSTLGQAKRLPLQSARDQKEGGVADFSEDDRDTVESREVEQASTTGLIVGGW